MTADSGDCSQPLIQLITTFSSPDCNTGLVYLEQSGSSSPPTFLTANVLFLFVTMFHPLPSKFWGASGLHIGTNFFSLYMLPQCEIIHRHGIDYLFYADDTQIYVLVKPENPTKECLIDIKN